MRNRDRMTMLIGQLALGIAVLGVGGAPRYVVVTMAILAGLAMATQIGSRRKLDGWSPLLVFLGIAVGLTALQLVPLPGGLASWLNGTGQELVSDGRQLLGSESEGWRPLSLDPPATLVELAKLSGYFLLAWMAVRVSASERGRARLMMSVAATAGIVVVVAIIHEVLGLRALYGVYTPYNATPVVMAPLLNANHLSCFLVLGAITAAGLALHEKKVPMFRLLWITIAAGCVGVMLMTRSRGGVIGFGGGATVMALLVVLQRLKAAGESSRKDVLRIAIPAAITVLCTLVLIIYIGGDKVTSELSSTRFDELSDPRSKYAAWASSVELFQDAPVLGIGRGAFETAFTRVHPQSGQITFSHVENEYLQTLLDWGLVGAIAFAAAIGFAALFLLRRWHRGSLAAAAIGGLAAVSVQSLVDFGLELPGLAVPTILVASTLLYVPVREATISIGWKGIRTAVCAVGVLIALLAGSSRGITVGEDHVALRTEATEDRAREAFERHPVDYLSAALIGSTSKNKDVQVAFVNHALRLHPTHPDLHLVVARWLAATKRYQQAAFEYRFALARGFKVELLVNEVIARMPVEEVAGALPNGVGQWQRILKVLTDKDRNDLAIAYLELAASDDPRRGLEFWKQLSALAVKTGKHPLALRAARQMAVFEPSIASTIRIAEAQLQTADLPGALATLKTITSQPATSQAHVNAYVLRCNIIVKQKEWELAKKCLTETLALPTVTVTDRRMLHAQMATVETALGNDHAARLERQLAGEKDPDPLKEIGPKKNL